MTGPRLTTLLHNEPELVPVGLCYLCKGYSTKMQHHILQQSVINHDILQEKFRNMKSSEKSPLHFLTWRQAKDKEKSDHGYTKYGDKINPFNVSSVFSHLLYYITKIVETSTQHSGSFLLSSYISCHIH